MIYTEIEDASRALNIVRALNSYIAPFRIIDGYRLIDNGIDPEATIQIEADGRQIHEAATGNGPVDALANVLKKTLTPLFPVISSVKLIDFRANILDSKRGTSTEVEVRIIFSDGENLWKVACLSQNINNSSFRVLVDGFEYAILKSGGKIIADGESND